MACCGSCLTGNARSRSRKRWRGGQDGHLSGPGVRVHAPKGEIKDLPTGSTPLDFAYRIHTDLGHRCVGAKVNSRLVPLNYQLKNGDVIEVLTSKSSKRPSRTG